LSNYKPGVGDRVEFIDPTTGNAHLGVINEYQQGRDKKAEVYKLPKRDYLVLFDEPLWAEGPGQAWVAAKDINLIKSVKLNKPTVTYVTSSTSQTARDFDFSNLILEKSNKVYKSTISTSDRPWTAYYVTADDFFDILRVAYEDTYGNGDTTPWHPEDMYANVSCVLEIVTNTLSNMARLKSGRPLSGIKES
jgi:hypothetical protein